VALLADDVLRLQLAGAEVLAMPSERHTWIDSGQAKIAVAVPTVAAAAVPLSVLVKLTFDASARAPTLHRVHGADAFSLLSLALIRFVLDDERVQLRDFAFLGEVAAACPVYELRRPKRFDVHEASLDRLLDLLGNP
jgi:hypothetical protein